MSPAVEDWMHQAGMFLVRLLCISKIYLQHLGKARHLSQSVPEAEPDSMECLQARLSCPQGSHPKTLLAAVQKFTSFCLQGSASLSYGSRSINIKQSATWNFGCSNLRGALLRWMSWKLSVYGACSILTQSEQATLNGRSGGRAIIHRKKISRVNVLHKARSSEEGKKFPNTLYFKFRRRTPSSRCRRKWSSSLVTPAEPDEGSQGYWPFKISSST